MISAFRAPTLTSLHDKLTARLVHAEADQLDMVTSVDVQLHNTISVAESMAWEFDLKDLWLTPSRWTMMVKQYIPPGEFETWLDKLSDRIGNSGRGIAVMRTNSVQGRGGDISGHTNKASRRWGSCMLAMSYKALPRPQITLYSRTSYLGYLSGLDLSVAWVAARYVAEEVGLDVEDISFVWINEALQYHNFKSLAYLLNHSDEARRDEYRHLILDPDVEKSELTPALRLSRNWMQKLLKEDAEGKHYGMMSYNTYRRIRRRFHTEVMGYEFAQQFEGHKKDNPDAEYFSAYKPLPHTYAKDLDFSKIGYPATWE